MAFPPEVWGGALRRLQVELPAFAFEAWLAPLKALPSETAFVLACPSPFHRERVRKHFLPRIQYALSAELCDRGLREEHEPEPPTIELIVKAEPGAVSPRRRESGPRAVRSPRGPHHAPAERPHRPGVRGVTIEPRTSDGSGSSRSPFPSAARATRPQPLPARQPAALEPAKAPIAPAPEPSRFTSQAQPRSPSTLDFSFDNFIVGPCNALAREAGFAIARDLQLSLNLVYLCSEPGMGKTHLARAVAEEAAHLFPERSQQVRYVSAEGFTNEFVNALREKNTDAMRRRYREQCRLLVVEDIQLLEHKTATQLEFFHCVQHVLDRGGKVLLTGDRMPAELDHLDARIRSLLASGFVAELGAPDADMRRTLLRHKAAAGGVELPGECLDLLVESVSGSVRDVEGVLIQLVATASLMKRTIDIDLTRSAIEKKVGRAPTAPARIGIPDVLAVVTSFFQTTPEKLTGPSRRRDALLPRQLAMYLCHRYTDASIAEIGEAMGRNHPSVRNAIQKVERAMLEQAPLRYQVEALTERLDRLNGPRH